MELAWEALDTAFQEDLILTVTTRGTLEVFSLWLDRWSNSAGSTVLYHGWCTASGPRAMLHLERLQKAWKEADHGVSVPRNMMDKPNEDQVIKTITIK